MGNNNESNKTQLKNINQEGHFDNVKSKYILKKIFDYLSKKKSLKIYNLNKKIQNRLDISIDDYIDNCCINTTRELEIINKKNKYGKFINIINKEEESYFHIYFNNSEKEIKKDNITKNDNAKKIKVIIDYQVKSFCKLFDQCECIESISFKKFYRNNITDMSYMFNKCTSLKNINFTNFNTKNVTNMSHMFNECKSLKKLDLSNFITDKVTDMSYMFRECNSLTELKISNFNTKNVNTMNNMFSFCTSIKHIPVYDFNTEKVEDMYEMFYSCVSLKDIILSNFNTKNVSDMSCMFGKCTKGLKNKIRKIYHNFKDESFEDYIDIYYCDDCFDDLCYD